MYGVDKPLFKEKIYAWKHGPVVKVVYNEYATYEGRSLPVEKAPAFDAATTSFLNEIYRVFGRYSAWALRDMTHKERPWLKNFKPDVQNIEIGLADLAEYFVPYVKKTKKAAR